MEYGVLVANSASTWILCWDVLVEKWLALVVESTLRACCVFPERERSPSELVTGSVSTYICSASLASPCTVLARCFEDASKSSVAAVSWCCRSHPSITVAVVAND